MQNQPRFGVVDNERRPVPNLQPIRSKANEQPANDELQTQVKLNGELLQRIEVVEKEKMALVADGEQLKKQIGFLKMKLNSAVSERDELKKKLDKRSSSNKENIGLLNQQEPAIADLQSNTV